MGMRKNSMLVKAGEGWLGPANINPNPPLRGEIELQTWESFLDSGADYLGPDRGDRWFFDADEEDDTIDINREDPDFCPCCGPTAWRVETIGLADSKTLIENGYPAYDYDWEKD